MKLLVKIFSVLAIIGILTIMISIVLGLDVSEITNFFSDDQSYGEQIEYVLIDEVELIEIDLLDRNIIINKDYRDDLLITYYKKENESFDFYKALSTLTMSHDKDNKFSFFNFKIASVEKRTVFITIPIDWNISLNIKTKTGNIALNNLIDSISYNDVILETNTGNIEIRELLINELKTKSNTGNTKLLNLEIINDVEIKSDTGNITLNSITSKDLDAATITGNIVANSLNSLDVNLSSNTGNVKIEESNISNLSISVLTGNITIYLVQFTELDGVVRSGNITFTSSIDVLSYKLDLRVTTGNLNINDIRQSNTYTNVSGTNQIKLQVTTGNITLRVQN